ncbi:kinesin motor domain protein [Ancylostoma duodenale]|uniref:Kinesin motor domain protein n=1 Tax=Ancylostoma duodenale TaxID=51022 RepID=A0A0C2HD52_9BILA|nr:kinesin motor domain protein [Ancylostoma duodenale]
MRSSATPQKISLSIFFRRFQLRLCAIVSRDDVTSGGITVPVANQIHIAGAAKSHSKNAFENVFGPDAAQDRICSNVLPELVQGVFNGQDCTFIALGGKSRGKECLLYGGPPSSAGIFQAAITSVFKITDEYRISKPDTRYQIRMSAVQYSQRENQLTDLLSPFNSDPRRRAVRVVDDPRAGALLENESEIRVDSPDLALFYLNTVADHRVVEDEETYRTSHVFVFLSVYAYRTGTNELEGGRRRLAIVDLGLGERNSHRGELTMPAIGSILLALVQGQKHLPARYFSFLFFLQFFLTRTAIHVCFVVVHRLFRKISLDRSAAPRVNFRESSTHSTLNHACNRSARRFQLFSDTASSHSSGVPRSEIESGSEVSGAETVIFLGPSPRGLHRSTSIYPPSSPSISSKTLFQLTQTSGSSGRTCTGSIPPMLKGHTPFLSPSLKLYDDLCSPPGTSGDGSTTMAHDLTVFGGHCTKHRSDFGVTIANSPKRSKRYDILRRLKILQGFCGKMKI